MGTEKLRMLLISSNVTTITYQVSKNVITLLRQLSRTKVSTGVINGSRFPFSAEFCPLQKSKKKIKNDIIMTFFLFSIQLIGLKVKRCYSRFHIHVLDYCQWLRMPTDFICPRMTRKRIEQWGIKSTSGNFRPYQIQTANIHFKV